MIRCVFERQERLHLHCRMKTYLLAAFSIHLPEGTSWFYPGPAPPRSFRALLLWRCQRRICLSLGTIV